MLALRPPSEIGHSKCRIATAGRAMETEGAYQIRVEVLFDLDR